MQQCSTAELLRGSSLRAATNQGRCMACRQQLLACRALLTQEGICLNLNPEFHFLEVAYPYVARRLLTAEDPILRDRLFQVCSQRDLCMLCHNCRPQMTCGSSVTTSPLGTWCRECTRQQVLLVEAWRPSRWHKRLGRGAWGPGRQVREKAVAHRLQMMMQGSRFRKRGDQNGASLHDKDKVSATDWNWCQGAVDRCQGRQWGSHHVSVCVWLPGQ